MAEMGVTRREPSGWAIGFTGFAGAVLTIVGFFHIITGIAAVLNNAVFVRTTSYVFKFNIATWGWIHLIVGVIVLAAGIGLFSGAVWARTIAVILAIISAIANFAFLPLYPVWSALMIAIDVGVIWALTTHGRDIAMEE
jgi:hypothetical protein